MSCGCDKVDKTNLWTPVPPYRQPTDIQPGENIDCYMNRAGNPDLKQDDLGPPPADKIANTSITSTIDKSTTIKETKVNETFTLTPESTRVATGWVIEVDGTVGLGALAPDFTFNTTTGVLAGQTTVEAKKAKNYKVKITANDGTGMIDSREFNLYLRDEKESNVKFIVPLIGINVRANSPFGPREPPVVGASGKKGKGHEGLDFKCDGDGRGSSFGDIVASADGVVVKTGPARGYGFWIIIDHFDSNKKKVAATLYAHMSATYVKVGQKVTAGQVIAKEGDKGNTSGPHLHFEIHRGGYKNPVDPAPYLSGTINLAVDNSGAVVPAQPSATSVTNTGNGMVAGQAVANNTCTPAPSNIDTAVEGPEEPLKLPENNRAATTSSCTPATRPSKEEVLAEINRAMDDDGMTDPEERDYIITVATIESTLDPYADNPTSSALGLYQFLDPIAVEYYGQLGYPVTCQTRCDAYKATRGMIKFFRQEQLAYWNRFITSGKTTIAGVKIRPTSWSGAAPPHYAGIRKSEFCYGLVHHDGCGNASKGIDKGGVAYWRSRRGT